MSRTTGKPGLGVRAWRRWIAGLICSMLVASLSAANLSFQSSVQFVYPLGDGSFVLGFTENAAGCPNAESPTKYFFVTVGQNNVSTEGARHIMATALLALAADKSVVFVFDDSTSS